MKLRDYSFLGTTQSLCPLCVEEAQSGIVRRRAASRLVTGMPAVGLVTAKIINRDGARLLS